MKKRKPCGVAKIVCAMAACLGCIALLGPAAAGAATIVNGGFESGSLEGWHVSTANDESEWFAYDNAEIGKDELLPPPEGERAAGTRQFNPDRTVLYQDVALEPGLDHTLSLIAGYRSTEPIVAPETLGMEDAGYPVDQQQYRIDVMKPTAPLDSTNPADILATVFRTNSGDPQFMPPLTFTADLSAFAGQTVRIRAAVAVTDGPLYAVLDGVEIASVLPTPPVPVQPPAPLPPPPAPSNAVALGKAKHNLRKGTETLSVTVPGAGVLRAANTGKKKLFKPVTLTSTAAATVKVLIAPTAATKRVLRKKHKSKVPVMLSFTPTGGATGTRTVKAVLRIKPRRRHRGNHGR